MNQTHCRWLKPTDNERQDVALAKINAAYKAFAYLYYI